VFFRHAGDTGDAGAARSVSSAKQGLVVGHERGAKVLILPMILHIKMWI